MKIHQRTRKLRSLLSHIRYEAAWQQNQAGLQLEKVGDNARQTGKSIATSNAFTHLVKVRIDPKRIPSIASLIRKTRQFRR